MSMPHSTFRSFHLQASCDDFSRIVANNIPIDQNQFGLIEISVTSVNFQNVIRTLRTDDTITINGITYQSRRERKNMTPMIWCGVLGDIINNSNVSVGYKELGILNLCLILTS